MDQILGDVGAAIAGFFDNPIVHLAIQGTVVYVIVLWLAAAYWAFRDMQLRAENPILPYFAASLIIVFTPIFFPLAVFAYRIIRPQEKIGEVYERNLAEEALLAEVEAIKTCPTCGRRTNDEWIICPSCRTRLNRVCPNCSRLVGLDWSLCAWCGKDFERRDVAAVQALPAVDEKARLVSGAPQPELATANSRPALRAAPPRPLGRTSTRGGVGPRATQDPLPER
jgi:RNA polymerase subunit RPABC4/transcription elongation factor Spt4